MEARASTEYIVIHCSATKPSMDVDAETIRNWHVNERGWRDIGYHKVIKRNGDVEDGRDVRDSGAHAAGYNSKSVGVCMVGGMAEDNSAENNFTPHQWVALIIEIKKLSEMYPDAKIIGHNEISEKECPSFDVQKWKAENL